MISVERADDLARDYLAGLQNQIGTPLQVIKRMEVTVGWVFFYNTAAYVESGDISAMLAGNAPFLVDVNDGSIHVFGTAHPPEIYIQEYERTSRKQ